MEAAPVAAATTTTATTIPTTIPTPTVSPSFLAEAVANSARLIDSMLPTDECTKAFVDSGGLKYLLQLHTLPLLPPNFSSSSACHALSVTLRAIAAAHPGPLADQVQASLIAVLNSARGAAKVASQRWDKYTSDAAADEAARLVEGEGVIINPATGFPAKSAVSNAKALIKPLAEAEAVLNLTTALLRSNPHILQLLLCGGEDGRARWCRGVIGNVGALHRDVAWLGAALAEGGEKRAAKEAAESKAKEEEAAAKAKATAAEEAVKKEKSSEGRETAAMAKVSAVGATATAAGGLKGSE